MRIDAAEAKRIIDILNGSSNGGPGATSTTTATTTTTSISTIDDRDITSILNILNSVSSNNSFVNSNGNGNEDDNLNDSEIARFKQIALATLRYALALSSRQLDPLSEKTCKKIIVSGLLPLTNLPAWIESYIISGIKLLIEHILYDKNGNRSLEPVNTMGIELLLPPYIARGVHPEKSSDFILTLCCMNGEGTDTDDDNGVVQNENNSTMTKAEKKTLNPLAAAALTASLHEIHKMNCTSTNTASSQLISNKHISSLIETLLQSLNTLSEMKEYESIPPLVYQLCGLTQLSQHQSSSSTSSSPFKKDSIHSYRILDGIAQFLSSLDADKEHKGEEVRWTIGTSLSHLSRILRTNPSLPNVLLNVVKGKRKLKQQQQTFGSDQVEPLCFKRMTPMLLAMGLTMASSIPRMKTKLLQSVKELVVDEEILRWKRSSSKWLNSTMAVSTCGLVADENGTIKSGEKDLDEEALLKDIQTYQEQNCAEHEYQSHVTKCLKSLITFADAGNRNGGVADNDNSEFSSLYPTLMLLGFMLVDCVKKDPVVTSQTSIGAYALGPIPTCASEVARTSMHSIQQKANFSAAKIGRSLLVHLFFHAGHGTDDEGVVTGSGISMGSSVSPLCRNILATACEKFCGMAPNAIEHSYLFLDIVFGNLRGNSNTSDIDELGAHIMEENFVPMIIDLLANVPGGGMPPLVATKSIIPVLKKLLKLSANKARRHRRKRNEFNDHVDHCFLLAKKALFCTDVERRKVAVNVLILLISIGTESPGDHTALLEEVQGYLRRCMTQHQYEVRLEVYFSLVALIPNSDLENSSLTQQPNKDDGCAIKSLVSKIFLSHLERYITVEEDEAIIQARRKRAIAHGTLLSQQVDLESNDSDINHKDIPLRIDMCITSVRSSRASKGGKKKMKSPDILSEAKDRISEPIAFLVAGSVAVINAGGNNASSTSELCDTLIGLRKKMSDCDDVEVFIQSHISVAEYKTLSHEYHVKALSTCLLVATVCDTLMCIPSSSGSIELELIGKLFRLRSDAVYKAAAIIATAKTEMSKKKKKSKTSDGDNKEIVDNESMTVMDSRSQESRKILEKIKVTVEKSIDHNSPALFSDFLAQCLRECGIQSQSCDTVDPLQSTQNEGDTSRKSNLSTNVNFRRFLLEKCKANLAGEAIIMKSGHRFDIEVDSRMNTCEDPLKQYIGPSFVLGPILFKEFVSLVQHRCHTSLVPHVDTPLTQIALEGFTASASRILYNVKGIQMDPKKRIIALLRSLTNAVTKQFPSFKDSWDKRKIPPAYLKNIPDEEQTLLTLMFPFIMPLTTCNDDLLQAQGGLLSELLFHGLDAEAEQCSQLLKCISHFLGPRSRSIIGLSMLNCFDVPEKPVMIEKGVIGLDYRDKDDDNVDENCQKSASFIIDTAIYLDGLVEGSVQHIWGLKNRRDAFGLTNITADGVKTMTGRTFRENDSDTLLGVVKILASSFVSSLGTTPNFDDILGDSKSNFEFSCTRIVSSVCASSELVSKHLSTASSSLLAAIEKGISDAEYLSTKIVPHVIDDKILLLQQGLIKLLTAIGKVICATAPCAGLFDDNGTFTSALLKSSKRLYAVYSKSVGCLSDYPLAAISPENQRLLVFMKGEMNKITMALLLTIQEISMVGTRTIADNKISSMGRIAGQVVFEIERCDNELLKISSQLKAIGCKDVAALKVSTTSVRDFQIKKDEIQAARNRVTKPAKKRKIKPESKKKTGSKKKKSNAIEAGSQTSMGDDNSIMEIEEDKGRESQSDDDLIGDFDVDSSSGDETEDEG